MNPTPRRPIVPAGYGIAATPPTNADWNAVAAKIAASRNYWIASTRHDGRPHAMPVWGVVVDGALYFGTDPKSMKGRNLAARSAVVVHLESGDDVVVLEGDAVPVADGAILGRYADAYDAKYNFRPDPRRPERDHAHAAPVGLPHLARVRLRQQRRPLDFLQPLTPNPSSLYCPHDEKPVPHRARRTHPPR